MSVKDAVSRFILENFLFTDDVTALRNDESLIGRGIVDSTGVMELIAFLEEQFGIAVDEDEMVPENLDTIDAIAVFVEQKRTTSAQHVAG